METQKFFFAILLLSTERYVVEQGLPSGKSSCQNSRSLHPNIVSGER